MGECGEGWSGSLIQGCKFSGNFLIFWNFARFCTVQTNRKLNFFRKFSRISGNSAKVTCISVDINHIAGCMGGHSTFFFPNFLKRGSCELTLLPEMGPLRTTREAWKGVFRAAHPHTPFLGQCSPGGVLHTVAHLQVGVYHIVMYHDHDLIRKLTSVVCRVGEYEINICHKYLTIPCELKQRLEISLPNLPVGLLQSCA